MNRLCINIKDDDKVAVVLNLLRELPYVEIEGDEESEKGRTSIDGNLGKKRSFRRSERENLKEAQNPVMNSIWDNEEDEIWDDHPTC